MVKRILPLLLVCFSTVYAGGDLHSGGGRSSAMGGSGVALTDLWSTEHNSGAVGFLKHAEIGMRYSNYFMMEATGCYGLAGVLPIKQGVFGINISNIGYAQYGEFMTGLTFGKSFGQKISAGIRLNHLQISQGAEYGKRQLFLGEFGLLAKLTSQVTFGAHLFNPTRSAIHEWQNERVPTILSAGLTYSFSDQALVTLEAEKSTYYPVDIRTGLEYYPVKEIVLRAGFSSYPQTFTFGAGVKWGDLTLDLGSAWHSILGFHPSLSLQYQFK